MAKTPTVVFIDDQPETLGPLSQQVQALGLNSGVYTPNEVDKTLLDQTDLFVVDYTIDDWIDEVDVNQLSLKPMNGIALAAVLRQHCLIDRDLPPTGFALITGDPGKLGTVPAERRPHIISRLGNIEWYFEKGTDDVRNAQRIKSLADAIVGIPPSVAHHLGDIRALMAYLGADGHPLQERFEVSVQKCRPPIHYLSKQSDGLIIVRWLLHRILPYTTFLMDTLNMAARFRVTPASLKASLEDESEFGDMLAAMEYCGPLSRFDGMRWWRDGIEQVLWDITEGQSSNTHALHAALKAKGFAELVPCGALRPVTTINHELTTEDSLTDISEVVPIQLDDWPSYAEPAYVRKDELAEHQEMNMFVTETI